MEINGYEITYPRVLLAGLLIVTVSAGIFGLSTSSTAFGSYNPHWDGTRDFRTLTASTGATVEITQSTTAYTRQPANQTTAVILSPTERYEQPSVDRLQRFLAEGGTLIVASDFGSQTNPLLEALGVDTRIDGRLLRDEHRYYRGPELPVATQVTASPVTANVSRLTLNHASALTTGPNSTVLVNTSGFAYFDGNQNDQLDATEVLRERPVVVAESVGDGRVIVLSDASVFINSMLTAPDNRRFARNLVTGADTVVFDYSHRAGIPPAVAVVLTVADTPILQLLVISVLVGMCAVGWRGSIGISWPNVRGEREGDAVEVGLTQEEVVARVTDAHPEWDAERVERVARRILSDVSKEDTDD